MGGCQCARPEGGVVAARTLTSFDAQSRYSHRPLEQDFIVQPCEVLGSGFNGYVVKARSRFTDQECAIKVLEKSGLDAIRLEMLRAEVNNYLKIDHPHVARLLHVYEDTSSVTLVMELCKGKELFDRMSQKRCFDEAEAVMSAYQMLLAIAYLHQHNIVHGDIKLENFVYDSEESDANLKLIDFGFSKDWGMERRGRKNVVAQGTAVYTAPEVFRSLHYSEKCDMWSLGVVIFMLLAGTAPFPDGVAAKVKRRARIELDDERFSKTKWKRVTPSGQDFVRKLLQEDPSTRPSALQCFSHPWIRPEDERRRDESSSDNSQREVENLVEDIQRYSSCGTLKRSALAMMAHHVDSAGLAKIRQVFMALDTNKSGTITRLEFQKALAGSGLTEEELQEVFDKVDVARDGEIHYSEFIAAVMESRLDIQDELLLETFKLFDVSRTGYITRGDLERVLGKTRFANDDIDNMISECGCKDQISFEAFSQYVGCRQSQRQPSKNASSKSRKASEEERQRKRGKSDSKKKRQSKQKSNESLGLLRFFICFS
eukprot:TRINITY_DN27122_c0_g1_i1.p1 TRINITY_DN27122_c0_g1~~TRINITY_DN27122_c0_g1_i1.p1  ORF type:complete len:542 (-),score=129.99 TRINITY_DN27122_c0_g1_i1:131-1756(-)